MIDYRKPEIQELLRPFKHPDLNNTVIMFKKRRIGNPHNALFNGLLGYASRNDVDILISSDINPFDFSPDEYKKLTDPSVAWIFKIYSTVNAYNLAKRLTNYYSGVMPELRVFYAEAINNQYVVIKDNGEKQFI